MQLNAKARLLADASDVKRWAKMNSKEQRAPFRKLIETSPEVRKCFSALSDALACVVESEKEYVIFNGMKPFEAKVVNIF